MARCSNLLRPSCTVRRSVRDRRTSSRKEARSSFRPAASVVSALWGFVANDRQAVRHVSSNLSKIPYGGFSPVRLQTETFHRHLHRLRRLIGGLKRRRPPGLGNPRTESGRGASRQRISVQRPLARRRVILSRRVGAYYGLIRASDTAPGGLWSSPAGLCLAAAGQKVPAFICESFCPCHLPYPGRPGGPRRLYLRP